MTHAQRRYLQRPRNSDLQCVQLAATQLGVVTRRQLLARGLTERAIDYRVATSGLIRCFPGVYRFPAAPASWQQGLLAACFWAEAVASHRAAGALWQAAGVDRQIEVTTTRCLHSLPEVVVHRASDLSNGDRGKLGPIPVTSPTRTVIDLAAVLTVEDMELALDDMLHRKLITVARVQQRLQTLGTQGRKGVAGLAALLGQLGQDPQVPTKFERLLGKVLSVRPLPPFVREYEVIDGDRVVARIDFAWPAQKVGVEADSFKWHSSTQAFTRDRERSNRLTALGWKLHRVTWWDAVDRPAEIRSSVASLLGFSEMPV